MTNHADPLYQILMRLRANHPTHNFYNSKAGKHERCGVGQRVSGDETAAMWSQADLVLSNYEVHKDESLKTDPVDIGKLDGFIAKAYLILSMEVPKDLKEHREAHLAVILINMQLRWECGQMNPPIPPKDLVDVIQQYTNMADERSSQRGNGFSANELAALLTAEGVRAPEAGALPKDDGKVWFKTHEKKPASGTPVHIVRHGLVRSAIRLDNAFKTETGYTYYDYKPDELPADQVTHWQYREIPISPVPSIYDKSPPPVPPEQPGASKPHPIGPTGSHINCPACKSPQPYAANHCALCYADLHRTITRHINCPACKSPQPYAANHCALCHAELHRTITYHHICLNANCRRDNMLGRLATPEDNCSVCGQPLDGEVRINTGLDADPRLTERLTERPTERPTERLTERPTETRLWLVTIEMHNARHSAQVEAVDQNSAVELARVKRGIRSDGLKNAKQIQVEPMT